MRHEGILFRISIASVLVFVGLTSGAFPQQMEVEPRQIVDCPTAGLLPRGSFDIDMRIFPGGGILAGISIGLMDRFLVGFSFGGQNVIGNRKIDWNPRVEFRAKYRLFEEGLSFPAIAIGFDSQGYAAADSLGEYRTYIRERKRYAIKSKGFYLAMSKNYSFLGGFGIHGGIYYSLERADGDRDISGYIGFDKSLNRELSLLAEYDLALNDNEDNSIVSGKGYLNAGVRWTFASRLNLELDFKDIAINKKGSPRPGRELRIVYLEYF